MIASRNVLLMNTFLLDRDYILVTIYVMMNDFLKKYLKILYK